MSRLRKLKRYEEKEKTMMVKTSSYEMDLDNCILKSGDVIGISVRIVNWEPWFQVYLEYDAGASSSFYDGPDMDKAFRMYMDVLIAFKGVSETERFKKQIPFYKNQIEKSVENGNKKEYHNLILKTPKFLGINDF